MIATTTRPTPPKLLYDATEASIAVGLSLKTLWSYSAPRGPIPVVRVGRRVLYSPKALQAWIEAEEQESLAAAGESEEKTPRVEDESAHGARTNRIGKDESHVDSTVSI